MAARPTSVMEAGDGTVTMAFTCKLCGQPSEVQGVPWETYKLWRSGAALAGDAFPELTPGQRETLISGSHEACFDKAFPEEEPEATEDDVRASLGGVIEADRELLVETWRAVAACPQDVERHPHWPADYDPVALALRLAVFDEHRAVALINLRAVLGHQDETWGKCPNCGLLSSVAGAQTVCSEACHRSFLASM